MNNVKLYSQRGGRLIWMTHKDELETRVWTRREIRRRTNKWQDRVAFESGWSPQSQRQERQAGSLRDRQVDYQCIRV